MSSIKAEPFLKVGYLLLVEILTSLAKVEREHKYVQLQESPLNMDVDVYGFIELFKHLPSFSQYKQS